MKTWMWLLTALGIAYLVGGALAALAVASLLGCRQRLPDALLVGSLTVKLLVGRYGWLRGGVLALPAAGWAMAATVRQR